MKYIIASVILLCCGYAGSAQSTPGEQVAGKIAQKMKDTLSLSESQRQAVYDVNMALNAQKTAVRQRYTSTDSIGVHLQSLERSRDTLYHPVLTPQQYQLYKQKKRSLVSNN